MNTSLHPISVKVIDNPQMLLNKSMCKICSKAICKYKCPRCNMGTCSLNCSKNHKKIYSCDGSKTRTNFVPISKFDLPQLKQDYSFLDEVITVANKCRKVNYEKFRKPLEGRFKQLRQFCKSKRGIKLLLPPPIFQRHSLNQTIVIRKENHIKWTLEFGIITPYSLLSYTTKSTFSEKSKMSEVLKEVYNKKDEMPEELKLFLLNKTEVVFINAKVFLKIQREDMKPIVGEKKMEEAKEPENHQKGEIETIDGKQSFAYINTTLTLEEILSNSVVYGYPTFMLILEGYDVSCSNPLVCLAKK